MRRTLLLLLTAVVPTLSSCVKPLAPVLDLPTADQIAEMRVSVPGQEGWGIQAVPEFIVAADQIPKILFWLSPTEPDRHSVSQGVERGMYFHVANVLIRTKDGYELRLRCYDWGKNPVAFTPNGKDYYLGRNVDEAGRGIAGGMRLYTAIKNAHEARVK